MIIRTPREIGLLVRESRRAHGLTQAALAARVHVSRKWIIDLEAGKRTSELGLVLRTLNALALELDISERSDHTPSPGRDIDAIINASRRERS
jgi:y4mF family transcriptional regulator